MKGPERNTEVIQQSLAKAVSTFVMIDLLTWVERGGALS